MKEATKAPFCDNSACKLHQVIVTEACTSLEAGEIKIDRQFFAAASRIGLVHLCPPCSGVVPLFVACESVDPEKLFVPKEKKIISV